MSFKISKLEKGKMINTSSFRSGGIRFLFIPRELDPINSGPKINTEVRKQDRGLRINIRSSQG